MEVLHRGEKTFLHTHGFGRRRRQFGLITHQTPAKLRPAALQCDTPEQRDSGSMRIDGHLQN